jgi:hypothetical protein
MVLVKGGKGNRCGLQIRRAFRSFLSQRFMWKDALPPQASRCVVIFFIFGCCAIVSVDLRSNDIAWQSQ